MPSLLDMPDIVLVKILERVDFMANQCLRKTCCAFQTYVDVVKADSTLSKIAIRIDPEVIYFQLSFDGCNLRVDYQKHKDGCLVSWSKLNKTKERLIKNANFIDIATRDMKLLLSHKKSILKTFSADVFHVAGKEMLLIKTTWTFLTSLKRIIQAKFPRLQVDSFQIVVKDSDQLLGFLPYLDANCIKKLVIMNSGRTENKLPLDRIVELDQWKNVEEVKLKGFYAESRLSHFLHFKRITVTIEEMYEVKLKILGLIFLNTPSMQYMKIRFSQCHMEEDIMSSFGPPDHVRILFDEKYYRWYHYYETPKHDYSTTFSSRVLVLNRKKPTEFDEA